MSREGKMLPNAVDIERAVLGACILGGNAFDDVSGILTPEVFYHDTSQVIFKALSDMRNNNQQIDMLTVSEELVKNGKIEMVGGHVFISKLTTLVASAAHIKQHAMIVKEKYVQREIIKLSSTLIERAYDDAYDDISTEYAIVSSRIDDLFAGKSSMRHIRDIVADSMNRLEERTALNAKGLMPGVETGLSALNGKTKGWQPGNLIILAARPAMGKTAIALNLFAKTAAQTGKKVCFFSLEMDDVSLFDRLLMSYGGVSKDAFKGGELKPYEYSALNKSIGDLEKLDIWIDDNHSVSLNYLRAVTRAKVRRGECDLVIIDYLQLMDSSGGKNNTREREVAIMSRSLKSMAKELKIPVILLCQLNRGVESRAEKIPQLSDLRESGSIEQDADIVIMPWRPEYYGIELDDDNNPTKNVILLEIKKNRDGETGAVIAKRNDEFTEIWGHGEEELESIPLPSPSDGMDDANNDEPF